MLMTIGKIKKEFEECPYLQHLGIEILSIDKEDTKIMLNVQPYHLNKNGTLHGGVYASMLDFIQKIHLSSVTKMRCVSMSSSVHFTAPVTKGTVYAEALILSGGYKTIIVDGIIRSESGEIISKGTGTFKIIRED